MKNGRPSFMHNQGKFSTLYGDAGFMHGLSSGGDDVLSGSRFADTLYGDAEFMEDQSSAGDDVLLGGKGNDLLYGDARVFTSAGPHGADRFVFGGESGKDIIFDFEQL